MRRVVRLLTGAAGVLASLGVLLTDVKADGTPPTTGPVTFTRDVAPVFFRRCAECHRPGESAPMSLLTGR
jgi:hypothetical protein